MKIFMIMKRLIRKIGLALVLLAFLKVGFAQVVDFTYDNPCAGETTHFVSTVTGSSSITSYRWYLGADTTSISNTADLDYTFVNPDVYLITLEAYIGNTVVDSESKTVEIFNLPIADFLVENACLGEDAHFVFVPTTDQDPNNDVEFYQWNFGDGSGELNNIESPKHNYSFAGDYTVTLLVTSVTGCTDKAQNSITIYELPEPEIRGTTEKVCEGDRVELYVGEFPNIIWDVNVNIDPNLFDDDTLRFDCPTGVFQLEVDVAVYEIHNDNTVCKDYASEKIMVNPLPDISVSSSDTIVLPGGQAMLYATSNHNIAEYLWNPIQNMNDPFSESPTVVLTRPTTYYVNIIDENGCKNNGSIFIDVDLRADNVVTPNADGYNDTWFAANGGLSDEFELSIFNRYGEEVLNQKGYENDWDGTSDGDQLPEGAYYYVIKHDDATYTGSITLLR